MIVQKEILLNETIWQSYLLTIHFTIEDLRDKDNLEEYYYLYLYCKIETFFTFGWRHNIVSYKLLIIITILRCIVLIYIFLNRNTIIINI